MLIAEELLLVALDPAKGTVPLRARNYVKFGLSGALLAELAMAGSLAIQDGRVVPAGGPPADPFLAEVRAIIGSRTRAERPKSVVMKLDKRVGRVRRRLVERMVAAGTLGQVKHGLLTPTRHPVLDRPLRDSVLTGVRAAAAGDGPLDEPRLAVLLALTGPCRLLNRVAPDRSSRRHARARIKDATAQAPFAPVVKELVDEIAEAAREIADASTDFNGSGKRIGLTVGRILRGRRPTVIVNSRRLRGWDAGSRFRWEG